MKRAVLVIIILMAGTAILWPQHFEDAHATGVDAIRAKRLQGSAPTFNKEVVRIFQKNCQSCHHPGDIAPFSLMSYQEARPWARSIREQVLLRKMPPWKPALGCGDFREVRGLTDEERSTIAAWVDAGSPEGNSGDLPASLVFPDGWSLGEPDLILSMPEEYTPPTGGDIYRCFSIPVEMRGDRYVSAVDVRPGNRKILHHVIGYLDPDGASAALDAADPGPGYTCFGGPGFSTTGILSAWAPGARAIDEGEGIGIKLQKNARVVLQLHYHPVGQPEKDKTQLGLYFARAPVKKELNFLPLENTTFSIPAGAGHYQVTRSLTTPPFATFDTHIVSIAPHMHLVGREIGIEIAQPNSQPACLVRIDDWDFNWQSFYHFKTPIAAPGGTTLKLTSYYDNTTANPRNPNSPPKTIRYGEATTDEMCLGIVGFTFDSQVLLLSSPQITGVTVDANGNLVVNGGGFLAGADIEINGRAVHDTRTSNSGVAPLLSSELWKVFSPPGQPLQVTVLNPDGVRSAAQPFIREGSALALAAVSAASFAPKPVAPDSVVAVFGAHLAGRTESASTIPLPTELAGTRVRVNGVSASLFFVSAGQINLLIPAATSTGNAIIEISASDGTISRGEVAVVSTSAAIFTSDSTGQGAPAGLATVDGVIFSQVGNPDGSSNEVKSGDFLVLFGTGIRRAVTGSITITIGGKSAPVLFAGPQGGFAGLDQINTQVPSGVSGLVDLIVTIGTEPANAVKVKVR